MVADREGTTLGVTAEVVWDLVMGGEGLGLDGFTVAVTGSPFSEVVVCDLLGPLEKSVNFLLGRADSLVLVEFREGEDLRFVWPCKSDAMEGRGDELGAVEGCDVDLDSCGGADRGVDIPGLRESCSSSRRVGIRRDFNDFNDEAILPFLDVPAVSSSVRRPSVGLGSRVSCKPPPLMGGGVNGTGTYELSDELRLVSCEEPLSILGGTRVGSEGWF